MDISVSKLEKLDKLGKIREGLNSYNNTINQSLVQTHNNSVSNSQEPGQSILSVLSFFAGFFTNQTVHFLRGVVKRLIPSEPYNRAPVEK